MKEERLLEERFGRDSGMRVPENYFDEVFTKISAELPAMPERPVAPHLSTWQKIRPYIYMAAMFAGIWCMMKVFHTVSSDSNQLSLDAPPEAVALAMSDPESVDVLLPETYESDYELETDVLSQYDSMEEFQEDFGYEISPHYKDMTLPVNS